MSVIKQTGFTVIELIVVVVFLISAGTLFFIQKENIAATARDDKRKVAINAMYFGLEKAFYSENGFYPEVIGPEKLPSVDPALFIDLDGIQIGQTTVSIDGQDFTVQSEYRYETTGCKDGKCSQFTLRAELEKEDNYVKSSTD